MRILLMAVLTLGVACPAIIPTLDSIAPADTGYTFTYHLALAALTKLDPERPYEQALVIYDFAGYIPGTVGSVSGNWNVSVEDPGPQIAPEIALEPGDQLGVPNLVFRYTGPLITGPQPFFDAIYADSIYGAAALDRYQGQGAKVVPPPDIANEHNTATGTDGNVGVPQAIPEPWTMGLFGSGMLFIGSLLRLRR